jgi:hypothetical protein
MTPVLVLGIFSVFMNAFILRQFFSSGKSRDKRITESLRTLPVVPGLVAITMG